MKPEVSLDGDETDAFSRYSRRLIRWARGETKKIKQRYNRRVRKRYKQSLEKEHKE